MTMQEKRAEENLRDSILIVKSKLGDDHAFGVLVGFYRKWLVEYYYKLTGNMDDAEDATQDVLILTHDAICKGKCKGENWFGGWIKRTATFHLEKLKRKKILKQEKLNKLQEKLPDVVYDASETEAKIAVMLEVIKDLPEGDVKLITLRYWEDNAWDEVGNQMGIGENSASGRNSKILKKIKRGIEGYR